MLPPLLLLRLRPLSLLPPLMRCGLRLRLRFRLRHRSLHLALRCSPRHHRRLPRPDLAGQQLQGLRLDLGLKRLWLRVGVRVGLGDLSHPQQQQLQQEEQQQQAGEEHQQTEGEEQEQEGQ